MTIYNIRKQECRNQFVTVSQRWEATTPRPDEWNGWDLNTQMDWVMKNGKVLNDHIINIDYDDECVTDALYVASEVDEELDELKASLEHALHVFQGILDDVSSGNYTKELAKRDIENLECNDGIDVMSVLSDYAGE